jgi:hypothetical protein
MGGETTEWVGWATVLQAEMVDGEASTGEEVSKDGMRMGVGVLKGVGSVAGRGGVEICAWVSMGKSTGGISQWLVCGQMGLLYPPSIPDHHRLWAFYVNASGSMRGTRIEQGNMRGLLSRRNLPPLLPLNPLYSP